MVQNPINTHTLGTLHHSNTSVVHLRRFAPSLLPGEYLKVPTPPALHPPIRLQVLLEEETTL